MSPRTSLAPRSAALGIIALGALALVVWLGGQWLHGGQGSEAEVAPAFGPGVGREVVRPEAVAEGLVAGRNQASSSTETALDTIEAARREDPHETRWGPEYWSLRVLDPLGDPLRSRGVRVSIDGRQTMGFTDRDARLHLARKAGARELEVAMRSTGPTSTWWVGRLALPDEATIADGGFEERVPLDLGSIRLVGEDQGSLQVLLPTGEPWSNGALQLNGRSIHLDADGRVPLPPHNRWGERLELQHPCLALPATLPDRLGDNGLPLQLNWSRGTLVVMGDWDVYTRLSVHARDPSIPEESPQDMDAFNRGAGDPGAVRLEQSTLLDYTVWVASELPPNAVDVQVRHPLWRRPLANRSLNLGSLVGNVGSPWITQPNRWAERATVQLVDSSGEPLEGALVALDEAAEELPGDSDGDASVRRVVFDREIRFAISAGEPTELWLPRAGANRVMATSADGRASIHDLRPGEQALLLADPLEIELVLTSEMRGDPGGFLSVMLEADGAGNAPRGWRSEIQSSAFPGNTVRFRVPASGGYNLLVEPAHHGGRSDSFVIHDSESMEDLLLQSSGRWHVTVAPDGSFTTSWE